MKNGWTGGQYSLFRAAFALYLLIHFLQLLPYSREVFSNQGLLGNAHDSPLVGIFPNTLSVFDSPAAVAGFLISGVLLAMLFGLGLFDRVAALLLWYVWACLYGRN